MYVSTLKGMDYEAVSFVNVDGSKDDKNSSMYIYAIYAPENADKVQLGFKEEIARFIEDGITEEELFAKMKHYEDIDSHSVLVDYTNNTHTV